MPYCRGKSTLLRMVAGLERVTGGEMRIGERVVNEVHSLPQTRFVARFIGSPPMSFLI